MSVLGISRKKLPYFVGLLEAKNIPHKVLEVGTLVEIQSECPLDSLYKLRKLVDTFCHYHFITRRFDSIK